MLKRVRGNDSIGIQRSPTLPRSFVSTATYVPPLACADACSGPTQQTGRPLTDRSRDVGRRAASPVALEPVQELEHAGFRVALVAGEVEVLKTELRAEPAIPLVIVVDGPGTAKTLLACCPASERLNDSAYKIPVTLTPSSTFASKIPSRKLWK